MVLPMHGPGRLIGGFSFHPNEHLTMTFNHRLLWSTRHVRAHLEARGFSEGATFAYFLAIMGFDWLQFTVIATSERPTVSSWGHASAWMSFAITVLGLLYLFQRNGGSNGTQFLSRYFPLSVTVGWKFLAASWAAMSLAGLVLAKQDPAVRGWSSTAILAAINCVMVWRMGSHIRTLANASHRQAQA